MESNCPGCGATNPEGTKVCVYCGSWLVTPKSADEELEMLREMQRISQGLEHEKLNQFWHGAPLMTMPESQLQDVIQSMARLKQGSEAWDLNSYDGELNKITKQRIETLLLSLKMSSDAETLKKVALLESEYQKRSAKAGCFPAEARVWTPEGTVPICELGPGDSVLSYHPDTHSLTRQIVTARKQRGFRVLQAIALANGCTVHTTASHSFLTVDGWRTARSLEVGDPILQVDRTGQTQRVTIQQIQRCVALTEVYNLHTTGAHSFIVEGLVAHNFTHLRGLRAGLHALVLDPIFLGRQLLGTASAHP